MSFAKEAAAFKVLYLADDICVYLPIGSVISNTAPLLTSQFGDDREVVVAYYLTEAWAEFNSFTDGLPHRSYTLTNKFDTEVQP